MQWMEFEGGAIHVEIADPGTNHEPPLDDQATRGCGRTGSFEKGDVEFNRDFAPGEHDADSLAEFVIECFEGMFRISDLAALELTADL